MDSSHGSLSNTSTSLRQTLETELRGAETAVIFSEDDHLIASLPASVSLSKENMSGVRALFGGAREFAIKSGVEIGETHFEVHRYDPPLIYGRTMTGEPHDSHAFAIYKATQEPNQTFYAVITFQMPQLTATMVPLLVAFSKRHIERQAISSSV